MPQKCWYEEKTTWTTFNKWTESRRRIIKTLKENVTFLKIIKQRSGRWRICWTGRLQKKPRELSERNKSICSSNNPAKNYTKLDEFDNKNGQHKTEQQFLKNFHNLCWRSLTRDYFLQSCERDLYINYKKCECDHKSIGKSFLISRNTWRSLQKVHKHIKCPCTNDN